MNILQIYRSNFCVALLSTTLFAAGSSKIDQYNLTWTTPSANAQGSMPAGNGDIGLNVWVESSGDLLLYISKVGAFSGTGDHNILKLGRIRIKLTPNPFTAGNPFKQTLELGNGRIHITAGPSGQAVDLGVWTDANNPVVHVKGTSSANVTVDASLETWRTPETQVTTIQAAGANSTEVVLNDATSRVVWYHRNTASDWNGMAVAQGVTTMAAKDPLINLTFGCIMKGAGMARNGAKSLRTSSAASAVDLTVSVLSLQAPTPAAWLSAIEAQTAQTDAMIPDTAYARHVQWWRNFWDRSYIVITGGTADAFIMSQNYTLQRFVNACSNRGNYAPPYNGSLFNVDVPNGVSSYLGPTGAKNADWRAWGSLVFMWQNTRLIYWPMLASGDFDLLQPAFKTVTGTLEFGTAKCRAKYGHSGSVMTEAMIANGPDPVPGAEHLFHHFNGMYEMAVMMLAAYEYTKDRTLLDSQVLPAVRAFAEFFDKHYPQRTAGGKIIMYPTSGLEVYNYCTNAINAVSGYRELLKRLLRLPTDATTPAERNRWAALLNSMPDFPNWQAKGVSLLDAASPHVVGRTNIETPQLLPVFPFKSIGIKKDPVELEMARQTFFVRRLSFDGTPVKESSMETGGWNQSVPWAALMGLPLEAARLLTQNLTNTATGWNRNGGLIFRYRFPAFWGPNFDWIPDQCHGGNSLYGLQSMILQAAGDTIFLLPAWPEHWNVEFKLHAPDNTTVEAVYSGGAITSLTVTPSSRAANVISMLTLKNRVQNMVSIASGDRNNKFNLPSMTDGKFNSASLGNYPVTRSWLTRYGRSINNTVAGPFAAGSWGGSTVSSDSSGSIYLHCTNWNGALTLPAISTTIVSSDILTGGRIAVSQKDSSTEVSLTSGSIDPVDAIVRCMAAGGVPPSPVNLALNRPAAASSTQGTNAAGSAVDGRDDTYWTSTAGDAQWISVDLGALYEISRVRLNWAAAHGAVYKLQASPDGAVWTDMYATAAGNSGIDNVTFTPANGRYVRMYGTSAKGAAGYALQEFEVYGGGAVLIVPPEPGYTGTALRGMRTVKLFDLRGRLVEVWRDNAGTASAVRLARPNRKGIFIEESTVSGKKNERKISVSVW